MIHKLTTSGSRLRQLTSVATLVVSLCIAGAQAQYLNGEAATSVLGQPNFTSTFGASPSPTTLNRPSGVAIDPVSGKLFVADSFNSRVLRYSSVNALLTGAAAEAVLGQPDFFTLTVATTQSGMRDPYGIFIDAFGRLWVADTGNNRIIWFNNAATLADGVNANGVLGQPNFTSGGNGNSAAAMNSPQAVCLDASGNLWVADTDNNRVVKFAGAVNTLTGAVAIANGAAATTVLGKPNFGLSSTSSGTAGMNTPAGVITDATGSLWVADSYNNRVLRFDSAAAKTNGANADGVLGQATFFTTTDTATQSGMFRPEGLLLDTRGTLYVTDRPNNRVLLFFNALTKANGGNADRVLGQPNFTGSSNAGGAAGLQNPVAAAITTDDTLFIADRLNNRVLRYDPISLPSVTGTSSVKLKRGKKKNANFTILVTNYASAVRLAGAPPKSKNFSWTAKLNGVDVTAALRAGTLTTANLAISQPVALTVTFKGGKPTKKSASFSLTGRPIESPSRFSTKKVKITVK